MGFFKKLASMLSPTSQPTSWEYWINVKCNRCGEVIRARVDLRNDLSVDYGVPDNNSDATAGGSGAVTYFCRKVLIGEQRCYQPIEVELTFDKNHKLIDRKVSGGQFTD